MWYACTWGYVSSHQGVCEYNSVTVDAKRKWYICTEDHPNQPRTTIDVTNYNVALYVVHLNHCAHFAHVLTNHTKADLLYLGRGTHQPSLFSRRYSSSLKTSVLLYGDDALTSACGNGLYCTTAGVWCMVPWISGLYCDLSRPRWHSDYWAGRYMVHISVPAPPLNRFLKGHYTLFPLTNI